MQIIKTDHLDNMDPLDHLDNHKHLDHLEHVDHLENLDNLSHLSHPDHPDHPDHLDLHDQPNQVSYNPDHQKIYQEDLHCLLVSNHSYLCPGIIVNHIVGTTLRCRLCYFLG